MSAPGAGVSPRALGPLLPAVLGEGRGGAWPELAVTGTGVGGGVGGWWYFLNARI